MRSRDLVAFDALADILSDVNDQLQLPDVGFYCDLARRATGVVVELGIGDGRVARTVLPNVGIDAAARALEHCRRHTGDRVQLVEADLAEYRLDDPAVLSYAPLNTLNHVTGQTHLRAVLRNIREQTAPHGLLAFDVALPDPHKLRARERVVVQRLESPTIRWDDVTSVSDAADGLVHISMRFERLDERGRVVECVHGPPMPFRFLWPDDVVEDLLATGWRLLDIWSDFRRAPVPNVPSLLLGFDTPFARQRTA